MIKRREMSRFFRNYWATGDQIDHAELVALHHHGDAGETDTRRRTDQLGDFVAVLELRARNLDHCVGEVGRGLLFFFEIFDF